MGTIDVYYLTGAGRDIDGGTAILRRVYFNDGVSPSPETTLSNLALPLSAYQTQLVPVNVDFSTSGSTKRTFQDFTLDLAQLNYTDSTSGSTTELTTITNNPYTFSGVANINVFPGRRTGVPIYLDQTMYSLGTDPTTFATIGVFDPSRFLAVNVPSDTGVTKINGFFTDYVSFDISGMADADKPTMKTTGTTAQRVFFTGDFYGLGDSTTDGNFEALTTDASNSLSGKFMAPTILSGKPVPGTYSLRQNDPSDITGTKKIISLLGIWNEHTKVLSNMNDTAMISFPSASDGNIQDVVFVKQTVKTSASAVTYTVTKLMFGYIEFNFDTDVHNLYLFNIKDLPDGIGVSPVLTGTLKTPVTNAGTAALIPSQVRKGTYTLSDGSTGTLYVYRK